MKRLSTRTWQTLAIVFILAGVIVLALSGLLGQIIGKTIDPLVGVQSWVASRVKVAVEFFTETRDVTLLREQNAALQNEVSRLQSEILQLQQQLVETDILYALLDFARDNPSNTYIAASVIGKDPSPFLKYIIIDHGSDDGIYRGMPVVTEQGLVGNVDAVTASAARVQLITDQGSVVNVKLKESKIEAQVQGSVTGDISLRMVSPGVVITEGDLVLTSGLGGTYPPELLIGQIESINTNENDLFQTASVQPSVDFNNLQAVLVITNFQAVNIAPLIPTTAP
ncbi:MAG: rod shape-determining protein MreC [Anaerolineaceae bacterium]|nr:rod shape-determining protein MreC [Anaerolineaceae bacterium]